MARLIHNCRAFLRGWWRCLVTGFHGTIALLATGLVIGLLGWLITAIRGGGSPENQPWWMIGILTFLWISLLGYFLKNGPERHNDFPETRTRVKDGVWHKKESSEDGTPKLHD